MRILYTNVIERNAPWGAEVFVDKALVAMGHSVKNVDFRKHRNALASQFLNVGDFDLFVLQRGDYFPVEIVRAINRPKVFWFSELFARRRDADHLFKSDVFDLYYVRTPRCAEELVARGWVKREKIGIMLSAFAQETHRLLPNSPKTIDVLFIGSLTDRRKQWLGYLKQRFPVTVRQVFGEELVTTINQAKIVLNIHASDNLDTETRVFEVLGCGAFLLSERLSSESPFRPGIHYVSCNSLEEMVEKIDCYLKKDHERQRIAKTGHEEALGGHTYRRRAEQIVSDASSISPRNSTAIRRWPLRFQQSKEYCIYWLYKVGRRLAIFGKYKT